MKKNKTSHYIREIDLPSLIPLWPKQVEDFTEKGTLFIIAKLTAALKRERKRAHLGHWSYSLNKHKALLEALECELETMRSL